MWNDTTRRELLADRLRRAATADPEIFAAIADDCTRIAILRKAGKAARLDQLLANGAWTDAALTMVAMELSAWTVRRLVYEDGEWLCSLSRQPNLPIAFDDPVEASHQVLALAALRAVIEVRRRSSSVPEGMSTVPQVRPTSDQLICCDNFA